MEWSFLSHFGITLFALLNPLEMLPIFISYTSHERTKVQRIVALFEFIVTGLIDIIVNDIIPKLKG